VAQSRNLQRRIFPMETKSEQISCPNCGAAIDVNQVLSHQLEERLRKEHAAEHARERKIIQEQEQKLGTEREALERSKKEMDAAQKEFAARLDAEVQQKLAAETAAIRAEAKKAAEADQSAALESMRQELQAK